MGAGPRHHMPHTSASWMSFTSEFWDYTGKTKSPLTRSLAKHVSHLCIPYSAKDANFGLDTFIGWRLAAFYKTWYMVNWPQGTETMVGPTTWESLADITAAWKQELSSSLKKAELAMKAVSWETSRRRRALFIKRTSNYTSLIRLSCRRVLSP